MPLPVKSGRSDANWVHLAEREGVALLVTLRRGHQVAADATLVVHQEKLGGPGGERGVKLST